MSATSLLKSSACDSPRRTAELLLCKVLAISRLDYIAHSEQLLSVEARKDFADLLSRRLAGEPVAYILGEKEFYGRTFLVNTHTLIPRPDTETLITKALETLPQEPIFFADMGTGSGCIAVTLAAERPHWQGIMLDISAQALIIARDNASRLGVATRLQGIEGDLTCSPLAQHSLDCCISNPPYIAREEYALLRREVREHEPSGALFSPASGLAHIHALIQSASYLLKANGVLLIEHGATQGASVADLVHNNSSFTDITTCCDMAGQQRCVFARRSPLSK